MSSPAMAPWKRPDYRKAVVLTKSKNTLTARHVLAREHGAGREQPLAAGAGAFVVVEELERAVPQLEDRDVGRRTHVERAAVVERREQARGIDRRTGDDLA